MAVVTVNRRVEAPPAQVFEAMSDVRSWADRISGIQRAEVVTEGEIGVGTRFRETRIMFKKECTEEMEFTAFDPPSGYTVECKSCGCHYKTDITLQPDGTGTLVEMSMNARPLTFMAKLCSPLSWLMIGGVKKCLNNDLADLAKSFGHGSMEAAPA